MNKEKLLVLMDKAEISENSNFSFDQLEKFKNLLLDEVIKELEVAKSSENMGGMEVHFAHNRALQHAIEKVEAMK
jgi:hypothetical protein